jgi:hypothetical protein
MVKFEGLGESQKASVKHLSDLLAKHETARLAVETSSTLEAQLSECLSQGEITLAT